MYYNDSLIKRGKHLYRLDAIIKIVSASWLSTFFLLHIKVEIALLKSSKDPSAGYGEERDASHVDSGQYSSILLRRSNIPGYSIYILAYGTNILR